MRKRFRQFFIIFLAGLFLFVSAEPFVGRKAGADEGTVRVLLSVGDTARLSMNMKGSYAIPEAEAEIKGGSLTIIAEGNRLSVSHSKAGSLYSGKTVHVNRLDPAPSAGAATFKVGGYTRSYLGDFIISASSGNITVINEVPLTQYLYGVVGYEMSNTWPVEALKAQTVAAKNYVLAKAGAGGAYDVKDTAADQVYKGYFSSLKNVISAVNEAAGYALYLNGSLIPCYYSASNGGYTILPSANWGETEADAAYSIGTDPFDMRNGASRTEALYVPSDLARRSFSTPELYRFIMDRLETAVQAEGAVSEGRRFDSFLGISGIVSTNADGTATADGNHSQFIMAVRIRTVPETSAAPASTPGPFTADPALPTGTPVPAAQETHSAEQGGKDSEVSFPQKKEYFEETMLLTIPFSYLAKAGLFRDTSLRLSYVMPAEGGWILFHGRYGHGVGMSQRGAQQMAKEGWTFDRILGFYYPGAELVASGGGKAQNRTPAQESGRTVTLDEKNNVTVEHTTALYSGAGEAAPVVETLEKGDRLQATAISGMWYLVRDNYRNKVGYVRYEDVSVTGETGLAAGIITGSQVNLRSGPGTDFNSIGRLDKNERVEILELGDAWYRVRSSTGASGYVSADYVRITGAIARQEERTGSDEQNPGQVEIRIAATPAPVKQEETARTAVAAVSAENVSFRNGPSVSSVILGQVGSGTEFRISGKTGSWYRAALVETGQEGFLRAGALDLQSGGGSSDQRTLFTEAMVSEEEIRLRSGPGNAFKSLGKLLKGTKVSVIGTSGNWYQILVADSGETGFAFIPYIDFESSETGKGNSMISGEAAVGASFLEMRKTPGTGKNDVIQRIRQGYTVTVLGLSDTWAVISYNGAEGYCLAKHLIFK